MLTVIRPWPILCFKYIFSTLQTSPICSDVKNALIRHFNVRSAPNPISKQALSLWQLFTRPQGDNISREFLQLFAPPAIHLPEVILVESLPSTSSLLPPALFIFDQWRAEPPTILMACYTCYSLLAGQTLERCLSLYTTVVMPKLKTLISSDSGFKVRAKL